MSKFYKVWAIFCLIMCGGYGFLCYKNYQKGNTAETIIELILAVIFLIGFIACTVTVLKGK